MHRQNILAIGLLGVVMLAVLTAGYASGRGPLGVVSYTVTRLSQANNAASAKPVSEEKEKRSFWDRLFSIEYHSPREERVMEYIIHRLGEGASLQDIVQEEYVRRNASPAEVDEICSNPRLVEAAREHMEEDFSSEDLDPTRRPH